MVNTAKWIQAKGFRRCRPGNRNEFNHPGFDHRILKSPEGEVELIRLAKRTVPRLLISTSGLGDGLQDDGVARASDFRPHPFQLDSIEGNSEPRQRLEEVPASPLSATKIKRRVNKPAKAAELSVANGASWGLMLEKLNQHFPFTFHGVADDPVVYATLKNLSSTPRTAEKRADNYFPPPESRGGWRKLENPDDIRRLAAMDPKKLAELKQWLLDSDNRTFAADVIRNGYIVLEVERGNSAKTDSRRVASVSKAICATVLAIASEQSQQGMLPKK